MWWVISASSISWSTRSTTSRRKLGSSSKIPCASCSLTLRWSSVIVAPFRSVDFEHQPSWRTIAFHSSGLQIYRSLGTQPAGKTANYLDAPIFGLLDIHQWHEIDLHVEIRLDSTNMKYILRRETPQRHDLCLIKVD